jgi:hypothetical protein
MRAAYTRRVGEFSLCGGSVRLPPGAIRDSIWSVTVSKPTEWRLPNGGGVTQKWI